MLNNVLNPFYAPNRFLYPPTGRQPGIFQGRGVSYLNRVGETSSPPPASYTPAQKTSENLEEYKKRKVA